MSGLAAGAGRRLGPQIALLLLVILFCVFPFYWMVTTSLKTQLLALEAPPVWIFEPTLANYRAVLIDEIGRASCRERV